MSCAPMKTAAVADKAAGRSGLGASALRLEHECQHIYQVRWESVSRGAQVHVYQVSPTLTAIEKTTARSFARLFGFRGPTAGGFTVSGGSASNMTSIVIARNTLYPETKVHGNGAHSFVLFTS